MIGRLDYIWQVLLVCAIGTFMVILDNTIVNIALPRIIVVFGSSVDESQLILTGYMLALAVIMPTAPYFSQTFGTKRMYLISLALFTISSALCGLAWNVPSLTVARVLQGLGGGMIGPIGMSMIFRVTPPERRGSVMSKYTMPVMLAPILGPTLGGFLVEYVDWRWVFLLNVGPGILGVVLGLLTLRETPVNPTARFDWIGFFLAAAASSGALLGFSDVPDKGWDDPLILAELLTAAISLPLFVWWQLRTPQPLLNLRLFAIPAFSIGSILAFVTTAALFGGMFLLPVFLQNVRGLGAMETGLLLFPQALASFVALQLSGRLYDRVGPRPLVLFGICVLTLATGLLARIDVTTPDAYIRVVMIMRGIGMGFTMMPSFTAWTASAPLSQTPSASALSNVLRQLYGAFGTAMYATILQTRASFHSASLSMFVQPDSPAVLQLMATAQQIALSQGQSLDLARTAVIAQLIGQVRLASMVRAFDDCFLVASFGCIIGLLPALFLRKGPARHAAPPATGPARLPGQAGGPTQAPAPAAGAD